VFGLGRQGFVSVSLGRDAMQVQFLDYEGSWVHEASIPRPT
jgi:hypothetical protein